MAKNLDALYDAGLSAVKSNAIRETVCSSQPANYAGIASVALAEATISSSDFTGPADGDTSGRKLTVGAKSGVSITGSGTATYVVLHDNSAILYGATTVTSQALTSGGTVDIGSWKVELADPS